jgi:AraC family transcriptional regulator
LPAGATGVCQYDTPLDVMMVDIDTKLLVEAGVTDPAAIAPIVGAIDPLTLQMALQVPSFDGNGTLYRETMHRALAAHLSTFIQPRIKVDNPIDDIRLRRVIDYIQDHLAEDLSLTGMADIAAMSPHHFSRAFKAATGTSPLQYVLGKRIELAKLLLKTTQLPVSEICFRTGYQDVSRFGQHFKRATGTTPAKYRDS